MNLSQSVMAASIDHGKQDHYEALLIRRGGTTVGRFSLGIFPTQEEAQAVIEEVVYEGYYKRLNEQYYEELAQ